MFNPFVSFFDCVAEFFFKNGCGGTCAEALKTNSFVVAGEYGSERSGQTGRKREFLDFFGQDGLAVGFRLVEE